MPTNVRLARRPAVSGVRSPVAYLLFAGFLALSAPSLLPGQLGAGVLNPPMAVSGPGTQSTDLAITLDAAGNVRLAFLQDGELRFATGPSFTPGGFPIVSGAGSRSQPTMHTAAAGTSTIVYVQDGDLWQVSNPGGPFGAPVAVSLSSDPERDPCLAGSPAGGALDLVWVQVSAGTPQLVHRRGGQPSTVIGPGDEPDLVHDGTLLHLVYTRAGGIHYRQFTSTGGWGPEQAVTAGASADAEPSVAVSGAVAHVVFTRSGDLLYTRSTASGFLSSTHLTVNAPGVTVPRLVGGGGGSVMAVYRAGGDLWRVVGIGPVFTTPVNLTQTLAVSEEDPRIALDAGGFLHVAARVVSDLQYQNDVTPPVADFTAQPVSGTAPLAVDFLAVTSGVVHTWHWDFGDGNTSSAAAPSHVYPNPGTYDVSLTASGPGGTDQRLRAGFITVASPQNHLWIPPVSVFAGEQDVYLGVHAAHAEPLQGFQAALTWDCALLTMHGMSIVGTDLEILLPEFIGTQLSNDPLDCYLTVGLLIDFNVPIENRVLAPGPDHRLMNMVFDVSPVAPLGVTPVRLQDGVGNPPIQNVFTIGGLSLPPQMQEGALTVVDTAGPGNRFLRGDVNANGSVNVQDAVLLLNYLFAGGPAFPCLDRADVNDNGAIDLADPIYLLGFLFSTGRVIPYPFPGHGLDPTPDGLGDC